MIAEAERSGKLMEGGTVVEGTSGSTGICLASLCRAKGYRCVIVMPDDQVSPYALETVMRIVGIVDTLYKYGRCRYAAPSVEANMLCPPVTVEVSVEVCSRVCSVVDGALPNNDMQ